MFVGGLIVFVATLWLSPLDLDSDTILALVGVFLGIAVAQWLIGRNKF